MGSVRWRTAIGRPLFFFSQEITIHLIKKDKGVMEDKKLTMPMIALRGLTVLPQMTVNFDIIRDKSIAAVEQAMVGDQRVFLATQKQPDEVIPDIDGIFQVGTIGYVKQLVKMPGGMVRVTVEGQERAGRGRSGHDSERGDAPDSERKAGRIRKIKCGSET